jgi:hypothetical protein
MHLLMAPNEAVEKSFSWPHSAVNQWMLLTHGVRAVLRAATVARQAGRALDGLRAWGLAVQVRSNHNKAACAVANKLARICYATLRDGAPYGEPSRLAHKLNRSDFAIAQ